VDDHQTSNARYLSDAGAAILLPQTEMSAQRVAEVLKLPRGQLLAMAEKARALAHPDATAQVVQACMELAGGLAA
jgi:UDP-N-acetylglucosamine--N-acetylmuramyl-(pentapeptide) pyrophosphoryl-undecaprenol N-acetylglucosamine transferase